jgi:endonuclease III
MKKEDNRKKAGKIISLLKNEYGPTRTFLNHKSPFQLLIATILSAQCTDKKVNEVTLPLFEKYKKPADFAAAEQAVLEQEIRQTGFFRNKAKNLISCSTRICDVYKGKVPDSMEELITLAGVARKTANIVLSTAFGKTEGIAVDTHVKRLSNRLGLSSENNPDKIETDLTSAVKKKDWNNINYLLISHGRKVCDARKPDCGVCVLKKLCPSALG